MLDFDFRSIGTKLLHLRGKLGLTQAEVAERAGLSDRTYADIERGSVNMRMETFLRICEVMQVTPDDILTEKTDDQTPDEAALLARLGSCTPKERNTAFRLLEVYLDSLKG